MNIEIANRLQKLRKEKGYSQESLADALGISRQAVSKWERAESSPDTDNLICLAKLYGVSLDELLSSDETVEEIVENNKDDEKREESFTINSKGFHAVDDEGKEVNIEFKEFAKHKKEHEYFRDGKWVKKAPKSFYIVKDIVLSIAFVATLTAFLLTGFLANMWTVNWILFLVFIAFSTIFDSIENRSLGWPGFVFMTAAVYCYLGIAHGLWHPYWFIFLFIPVFYIITGMFDRLIKRHNPNWDLDHFDEDFDEDEAF